MWRLMIRAVVLAGVILGFSWGTGFSATLPWATFSEAAQKATNAGGRFGACQTEQGEREILVGYLEDGARQFWYYYSVDTQRIVFALVSNEGVLEVGFGTVNPEQRDVIPPLRWEPYDLKTHGDGPCGYLLGLTA